MKSSFSVFITTLALLASTAVTTSAKVIPTGRVSAGSDQPVVVSSADVPSVVKLTTAATRGGNSGGHLGTASLLPCRSGYAYVNGACVRSESDVALSPSVRASLAALFATPGGRSALLTALRSLKGAHVRIVPQSSGTDVERAAISCPGGAACGLSWSGGPHFWLIMSYTAYYDYGIAPLWGECTGALAPEIDPVAAGAVCGEVAWAVHQLVSHAYWTTHHGFWLSVGWRGISDGLY